jgi:sortase A
MRLPSSNWWSGDDPLLKLGVVMMSFALALTVGAVVFTAVLRHEPERAVAVEAAVKSPVSSPVEPLVRSYPPTEPRVQEAKEPQPEAQPPPPPPPPPRLTADLVREPQPEPQVKPQAAVPPVSRSNPEQRTLPVAADDWPTPTDEELQAISAPRDYELPPGAIMGLTIEAMGLRDVPVFNSDSESALAQGVIHEPETSLPWSNTPETNVFLAGHYLGYQGTSSRLVFYNLNELAKGDRVVLKDRDGKAYHYRVSEMIVVDPTDVWVMGKEVGRDMVTLQTCTPYPTFEKRLIVRADRV